MKKFLKKKPVMITFIALAVVMLIVYIGMLVRPVAIGFTYRGQSSNSIGSYTYIYDIEDKIGGKTIKSVTTKTSILGNSETVTTTESERYYFTYKGFIVVDNIGAVENDDEFKDWKNDIKENWDTYKDGTLSVGVAKTNAFKIGEGDDSSSCVGSIVFAVVGGILLVAVVALAGTSVVLSLKKDKATTKKKSKK